MEKKHMALDELLEERASTWPAPWLTRKDVKAFTGGALTSGTLANLDCAGEGPEGRFIVGKNTCYPVRPFIKWLRGRVKVVGGAA